MANYTVDILVALKGAQKLTAFNKKLEETTKQSELLNKTLKAATKDNDLLIRSFNNLNKTLVDAKANFNNAASGTKLQEKAARQLIAAEKDLNRELRERERILQSITLRGQSSSLVPGSSLFGQSVTPEGGAAARSRQIHRETQELQAALARMNQRSYGRFGFLPPDELTGQNESVFRGQSSPVQARIKRILDNRKKSEKEIIELRAKAQRKREVGEAKLMLRRQRGEERIAATRQRGGFGQMIGSQFAKGGMFAATKNERIKGSISSALIGGGFPLLFGQGALGALGGGIGGAIGGALGGPFGFGLSIAGTAIAQRIQEGIDFQKQIDKLNKSIRLTGGESEFSVAGIKKLGRELGFTKQEALEAASSFEAFGASARISLTKVFGDEATFDTLKNLRSTVDVLNNIDAIEKKIGKERASQAVNIAANTGSLQAQKFILDEILKSKTEEAKKEAKDVSRQGFSMRAFRSMLSDFNQILSGNPDFLRNPKSNPFMDKTRRDILEANTRARSESEREFNEEQRRLMARDIIRRTSEPKEEFKKLIDPLNQLISLSRSLGDSFAMSFKGIISGSMNAQEALRNLFQRTADHFLDMAAQMIAKQITMRMIGIGLSFMSNQQGFASERGANRGGTDKYGRDFDDPNFGMPNRATGGPVSGGKPYIVGEEGPEIFTPGVSGGITPNHALGGSTNISVNIDASGTSVEGSEPNGEELGRLVAAAIQSELIKEKRPGGLLS